MFAINAAKKNMSLISDHLRNRALRRRRPVPAVVRYWVAVHSIEQTAHAWTQLHRIITAGIPLSASCRVLLNKQNNKENKKIRRWAHGHVMNCLCTGQVDCRRERKKKRTLMKLEQPVPSDCPSPWWGGLASRPSPPSTPSRLRS